MSSPIQYTSRTYNTILNDINNDPELIDKPEWFKRMIAGLGDMLSMIENATANQSFLRTAFTRQAVQDLCSLIDYELTPQTTSSGEAIFYMPITVSLPNTFTASELKGLSQGNIAVPSQKFEARIGKVVSASTGNFTCTVNDLLTVATDFGYTGHKFRFTTTGTLPTGLAINTDYYCIYVDATTIKVALTLADAFSGTNVSITSGTGAGTHTWTQYSFHHTLYQQETKASVIIGSSDGSTVFQTFDIPEINVLPDTISIVISGSTWTKVDTLVDSISTDKHYVIRVKEAGKVAVQFGDGTYGAIPTSASIEATYSVGGGATSNIQALNRLTNYTGGATDGLGGVAIDGITNTTIFTGGADEETIESAKSLAPLLLKARQRFVTVEDGEALALAYGGLSLAKINKNAYGLLSAQVVGVAMGGGKPGASLRATIEAYLERLTSLQEIDVYFDDCTLTPVTIVGTIKIKSSYTWATIYPYIIQAIKIFFSETQKQLIDNYKSYGLDNTITLINTIFSTSWTYFNDGTAIQNILEELENIGYRTFGDSVQLSVLYDYMSDAIPSIDYMLISSPAFPITTTDTEFLTHSGSTFTITQIV